MLEPVRGKPGKPELEKKSACTKFSEGPDLGFAAEGRQVQFSFSLSFTDSFRGTSCTCQYCQAQPSDLYVLVLGCGLGLLQGVPWLCQAADQKEKKKKKKKTNKKLELFKYIYS